MKLSFEVFTNSLQMRIFAFSDQRSPSRTMATTPMASEMRKKREATYSSVVFAKRL
jgi:hypothetical protein